MKNLNKVSILILLSLLIILLAHNTILADNNPRNTNVSNGIEKSKPEQESLSIETDKDVQFSDTNRKIEQLIQSSNLLSSFEASFVSLKYPVGWIVYEAPDPFIPYVRIENYDVNQASNSYRKDNPYVKFEIYKLKNDQQLSLKEWVNNYNAHQEYPIGIIEEEKIIINNKESVLQIKKNLTHNLSYFSVYVPSNDSVYMIVTNSIANFEADFDEILRNFRIKE